MHGGLQSLDNDNIVYNVYMYIITFAGPYADGALPDASEAKEGEFVSG